MEDLAPTKPGSEKSDIAFGEIDMEQPAARVLTLLENAKSDIILSVCALNK